MAAAKLADHELGEELKQLPRWAINNGKLHREYKFPDFVHAFAFMTAAALVIEKMNHHPEWLNVYNRLTVDLVTHDAGGITLKDIELAKRLEALAAKFE